MGVRTTAVQVGTLEAGDTGVRVGARVLVSEAVGLGFRVLVKMGVNVIVEVAQGRGVCVRDALVLVAVFVASDAGVGVPAARLGKAAWVSVGTKMVVWLTSSATGAVRVSVAVALFVDELMMLVIGGEKRASRVATPPRATAIMIAFHPSEIRRWRMR